MAKPSPAATTTATPEVQLLRDRAEGRVSVEASFERLYAAYAPLVVAWFQIRVGAEVADDLFQDVWLIFYNRWRRWEVLPEMLHPEAKPVLSFLFRTAHFVLIGHRRQVSSRKQDPIGEMDFVDGASTPPQVHRRFELGRCLDLAKQVCPPEEIDVLLAKLAGVPAREIAKTLQITEPVVDHRFRSAIARVKQRLKPRRKGGAHGRA